MPLFVTVTIMDALDTPWVVAGKVTELDESETEGAAGVVGGAE
jgi:hypothetical protein